MEYKIIELNTINTFNTNTHNVIQYRFVKTYEKDDLFMIDLFAYTVSPLRAIFFSERT